MPTSSPCNVNHDDVVFIQCKHQWHHATLFLRGTNGTQMLVTWFASYANLVMSQWACTSCAHVHGARALLKMGASKYLNGLTGTPADLNLTKLTTSHFNALITQNANKNMPNMFPLVYLNENLRYCNEN